MKSIRVVCGIISVMLIVVGMVAGLHEMTDLYSNPVHQLKYVLGSMIGMLAYVAGIWVLYGIVAGIRLIVIRHRQQHQPR